VLGGAVTLVLAYAVARGGGHPLYEAIAREQDAPHRTYYIVVPYFATLVGGLASNLLFGHAAVVGYLVGGLGDAAGEPVGTRWGRHRYPVPGLGAVRTTRSVEGSLAVLAASLVAAAAGVALGPQLHFTPRSFAALPVVAAACALVEAASPHGWDNLTMQLVPALMAFVLL
jgi:phytol kinase